MKRGGTSRQACVMADCRASRREAGASCQPTSERPGEPNLVRLTGRGRVVVGVGWATIAMILAYVLPYWWTWF